MCVGDREDLEHPLDAAVLAVGTVECIEGDVGLQLRQDLGDVATDVHPRHPIAGRLQRVSALLARIERNRALARPPAHQDGDVLGHGGLCCSGTTRISDPEFNREMVNKR